MRYRRFLGIRLALAMISALAMMAVSCADDGDDDATATTTTTDPPITTTTTEPASTTTDAVVELPVEVESVGDVAYTSGRMLDVYAPAEGSGWPVVVYFHGGWPIRQPTSSTTSA
jgi:acetyl esterase/lipase